MHSIFDVAKVVLQMQSPMTTMKLQKLLYYAQAWSLVWDEQPLFNEEFEAWATGPICPALYEWQDADTDVDASMVPLDKMTDEGFTEDQYETIRVVVQDYGERDAEWLSELTHIERPWRDARKGYAPGQYCHEIIPKHSMTTYYGSL